jgi:hypothetical protein
MMRMVRVFAFAFYLVNASGLFVCCGQALGKPFGVFLAGLLRRADHFEEAIRFLD